MPTTIDTYIENSLDLLPLDLPGEDLIDNRESDVMKKISQAITLQVNLPNSRFGPGRIVVSIHPEGNKALFMAASPNMFRNGLKRTAILDAGLGVYEDCWDKPTTAGVAGCVVETAIQFFLA